ncbi:hypothetical protein RclHR1_24410001 [Rhizophagus clarus]|uniref:Uncharacterized protein n=1 Tax=Rhizophagus clarus TaxID=94130 RepID=A0A2Z6RS06_9GLOM|nr:hypothetical protein RclHR1_24410001 [Rhizophagus clarus]GES81509.1 hypothetical protein RCL_e10317_RclHR1_24410001 [Rhizophagus clarus]
MMVSLGYMEVTTSGIINHSNTLNGNNAATCSTLIRLRNAQIRIKIKDGYYDNIPQYRSLYMTLSHMNLALFFLLLASDLYINFKSDYLDMNSFKFHNVEHPILDIWLRSNRTISALIRSSLKTFQFLLLDLAQIISGDSSTLMMWKQYCILAGLSCKGPKAL